ncbi:MAG: heme o synthase [Pseudomonadota bacterium]
MTDTVPSTSELRHATANDYIQLMKPRIMGLVVFTGVAGLAAAPGAMNPVMAVVAVLAIALGSGAAGALNMWYDSDIDAVMSRTSSRPIPSGAVPREEALALGLIISGISVLMMWLASNTLAAGLLALSIVYYAWFYTIFLKRRTHQNIVIGGAAGAFPPVIGWAAVTGTTPLDPWILFAIIFFWTPPHFWALSLLAHKEYARVGVPMLPVTHGARSTRRQIFAYTFVLAPVALAPVVTGLAGWLYAVVAAGFSTVFIWRAYEVLRSQAGEADAVAEDHQAAKKLFVFSIFYLFAVFGALLIEYGTGARFPVIVGHG